MNRHPPADNEARHFLDMMVRAQRAGDLLANAWPNLSAHCRTVSWLTTMPRAASISSTMRSPSGKRKYSHTAWLITSAGKRWPA